MNKLDEREVRKAIAFIEELGWFLDSKKALKLKDVPPILRAALDGAGAASQVASKYTSPNPNIHFLIGTLPRLFQDMELFPNNGLIANFAQQILGIEVSRYEKRSKYELIGLIVCETDRLSDEKLAALVRALAELTKDEDQLNRIRAAKKDVDFSWNKAIRSLVSNSSQIETDRGEEPPR